jgi:hypothetical protein
MANNFSVDRARFLAVAAALAGIASFQACTIEKEKAPTGGDAGAADGGSNSGAGTSMTSAGQTAQAGEGGSPGGAGGAAAGAGGATEGGAMTELGGAAPGGAAGAGGAAACDDTVGSATCDGVTAACTSYCNAALSNLKPAVAAAAVTCLEADQTDNCDAGYTCLADATAKGCPEDVAADCTAAETTCTSPDASDPPCSQLLSGFSAAARAQVITCTAESCFSVYSCAEGFFFQ